MTGLSQSTLGRLRSLYASAFVPGDTSSPVFTSMVNQVLERFYTEGGWVGAKATFTFEVSATGYITLPYHLEAIINARIDDAPRPTFTEGYEFLFNGPGQLSPTETGIGVVVDAGDVATYVEFPTTAAQLTVAISDASDADKTIRIMGEDENDEDIIDAEGIRGEQVTLVSPTTTTTSTFSSITGIQKPITEGRVTIKHGTTTLATLEPSTERPLYRRYKVAACGAEDVVAFCKRRFVPVSSEEDYVVPGHTGAMKMGLYALNYEEHNDLERAEQYWAKAFKLLNDEATQHRSGARAVMDIHPHGLGVNKVSRIR